MAVIVDLPGAVAPWRQAEMRPHIARSLETLGDINPGAIGQRDDHADARHGHEAAADCIMACKVSRPAVEMSELVHQNTAHAQHGRGNGGKGGTSFDRHCQNNCTAPTLDEERRTIMRH